jgi:hypothetical protein
MTSGVGYRLKAARDFDRFVGAAIGDYDDVHPLDAALSYHRHQACREIGLLITCRDDDVERAGRGCLQHRRLSPATAAANNEADTALVRYGNGAFAREDFHAELRHTGDNRQARLPTMHRGSAKETTRLRLFFR